MERIMALESETVETFDVAALQLSPAERASLVDRLKLNRKSKTRGQWRSSARQSEIENGTVSLLPGPEILAKVKAEFG